MRTYSAGPSPAHSGREGRAGAVTSLLASVSAALGEGLDRASEPHCLSVRGPADSRARPPKPQAQGCHSGGMRQGALPA